MVDSKVLQQHVLTVLGVIIEIIITIINLVIGGIRRLLGWIHNERLQLWDCPEDCAAVRRGKAALRH